MTFSLVFGWIITVGSLAGLLWWVIRLVLRGRHATAWTDGDASADFSLDRYQAMAGLLSDDDLVFLQAQPGYRAEMGVRWKRERRRIFRLYLHELKNDFRRLHKQAREMVAQSGAESADLVGVLMKQQTTFWRATTALEFRLALESMGIGKVDAGPFMQLIEAMRVDLAQRTGSLTAA
jgi:hypothetical protein